MPRPRPALTALLACLITAAAAAQTFATDGLLDDWAGVPVAATDPAGDAAGPIDLTALRLRSAGTRLYMQFDLVTPLNLAAGPAPDPTLTMTVTRGASSVTVNFRARTAYLNGAPGNVISWPDLGFVALPTVASTRFELELNLAAIGATTGQTVTVAFAGADSFPAAVGHTLGGVAPTPARRSPARPPCDRLRVATLNTGHNFTTNITGLADPLRRDAFARLIDAVNADVYCFTEEYSSTEAQVLSVIAQADPLDDGATWNITKSGEFAIVSRYPLVPVAIGPGHYGAVVRPPGGPDVLVISNHLKCCGYIGHPDDTQRIGQTTTAVAAFASFRAGTLSPALVPYRLAPAVVLGDMNLVGSATPSDLWSASPGPSLTRATVRHLIGDGTHTWASPSGLGFWPGVLDAALYEGSQLRLMRSFSLDTAELNPAELAAHGLLAGDSTATDHRMLVIDLAAPAAALGDTNCDCVVNFDDIEGFVAAIVSAAAYAAEFPLCDYPRADINSDGVANFNDIDLFVECLIAGACE